MVPTSHLSKISFYSTSRSTNIWVSTRLASSILLAISALFFHREPSAGTHGVFVFVFIGNQVLEPTALLSLLSFLVPGHLARASARYQYFNKFNGLPWSDSERVY